VRAVRPAHYEQFVDLVCAKEAPDVETVEREQISFVAPDDESGEGRPIIIQGEPGSLRGAIPLVNNGEKSVRRATLTLGKSTLRTAHRQPLEGVVVRHRLEPGQPTRAMISFSIDERTHPGTYEAEFVLGEKRHPVVFHVAENLRLEAVPRRLVLDNDPGSKVERTVHVTNTGNVEVQIGDVGPVVLEEYNQTCNALRNAIRGFEGSGFDAAVDAVIEALDRSFNESGFLRIRTKEQPVVIPPGETRSLKLEISLPDTLWKTRRYRGRFRLYNVSVPVVLQPTITGAVESIG
jgi:hypothetical protein